MYDGMQRWSEPAEPTELKLEFQKLGSKLEFEFEFELESKLGSKLEFEFEFELESKLGHNVRLCLQL